MTMPRVGLGILLATAAWLPAVLGFGARGFRPQSLARRTRLGVGGPATETAPDLTRTVLEFLNAEMADAILGKWVLTQSAIGAEAQKKNAFTAGSFTLAAAKVLDLNLQGLEMEVQVREKRLFQGPLERTAQTLVPWPEGYREEVATGSPAALRRALMAVARRAQTGDVMGSQDASVALLELPLGEDEMASLRLPNNWFLNNVPHSQDARRYIYADVRDALLEALQPGSGVPLRSQITLLVPETNPSMDTFRIGTMLEMLREAALAVAYGGVDGKLKKVRLLVQPSMGEGAFTAMPLALSGVRALLEMMDWGELPPAVAAELEAANGGDAAVESAEEGLAAAEAATAEAAPAPTLSTAPAGRRGRNREAGTPAAAAATADAATKPPTPPAPPAPPAPRGAPQGRGRASYGQLIEVRGPPQLQGLISFGTLGAEAVDDDVDLYISISPQNIVGGNVLEPLERCTLAAERKGQRVILVNPRLEDRPSPNDVMQIRGRAERRAFAESFQANEIYELRLLYTSGVAYFPIRGALYRKTYREPYVLSVRRDVVAEDREAIATFGSGVREVYQSFCTFEDRPRDKDITEAFQQARV